MTQPDALSPLGHPAADAPIFGPLGPTAPSCTNWDAYELPAMWASVEHEDPAAADGQLTSWRRVGEALDSLRERLAAARADLAEGWPPEKNAAAAAFIADIDELEASLRLASASAHSTERGLYGVVTAIAQAKTELKPIMDDYLRASTDLIPHWMNGSEDDLNRRAREVMAKHEAAVLDHGQHIQLMPRFRDDSSGAWNTDPNPSSSAEHQVPPIERTPPPHTPGIGPLMPPGEQWASAASPQLAGAGSMPIGETAGSLHSPSLPHRVVQELPPDRLRGVITAEGGVPPELTAARPKVPTGLAVPGGPVGSLGGTRAAASGLIRGPFDAFRGGHQASEPAYGSARPNSQGVIGAGPASETPHGRSTGATPSTSVGGARPARPGAGEEEPIYRSGDIQWEVPQGVPGLIEVGPEPGPHDPGPGRVIGA